MTPTPAFAERTLETAQGLLHIQIGQPTAAQESASCEYRVIDQSGALVESSTFYGVDTLQALLFCITAAGDWLKRFHPDALFVGMNAHGLLTTDFSSSGEWRAEVSLPTVV